MAAASAELHERLRTSGLALLTTVTSIASLASSVLVGAVWSVSGMDAAFEAMHLAVLDLATLQEMLLSESRSVDDQVQWLDDRHILYSLARASSDTDTEMETAKRTPPGPSRHACICRMPYHRL